MATMITRKLIIVAYMYIVCLVYPHYIHILSENIVIFPGRIIVLTFLFAILTAILLFLHPGTGPDSKDPHGCQFDCNVFQHFLRDWGANPMPNPQPGRPRSLSLCLETRSWHVRIVKPCQYLRNRLDTPDVIDSHSPRHHEKAETPSEGGGVYNTINRNF